MRPASEEDSLCANLPSPPMLGWEVPIGKVISNSSFPSVVSDVADKNYPGDGRSPVHGLYVSLQSPETPARP